MWGKECPVRESSTTGGKVVTGGGKVATAGGKVVTAGGKVLSLIGYSLPHIKKVVRFRKIKGKWVAKNFNHKSLGVNFYIFGFNRNKA